MATDTPGKFRWQSGILTTAVTSGRWLLVEDIDLAPAEVISALVPLLESRTLFIPARGEVVKAEPGFRLFATRSTSSSSSSSGSSSAVQGLSDGLWTRIHIPHPPRSDILCILQNGFPLLAPYAEALLDTFNGVSKAASTAAASRGSGGGTAGRVLTLRDLLKWCTRMCVKGGDGGFAQALNEASSVVTAVSSDAAEAISNSMEDSNTSKFSVLPLAVREIMFREAIDCFIGMVARDSARDILYAALGSALGVPEHRVQFYVNVFVPHLNALDDDPNVNGFSGKYHSPFF